MVTSPQQSQQSPQITYALQEKDTSLIFDPLPWQPIILPSTVQVSDKDLSVEIAKILVYLQDTQQADWQQRVTCLKRLQELAPNLKSLLPKLLNPLKAQVHDLRSVSAKEAGITIQVLARHLEFDSAALKLIPSLVKLLHCGNKILSDIGHQTIKGILNVAGIDIRSILATLTAEIQASKAGAVQHKLATYLYYLVTMHNQSLQREGVESYLKSCFKSPNPECRQVGRRTFLVWQQVNKQSAEVLFQTLDYNAQRAICDEVELWVVVGNKTQTQSYHQGVESKHVRPQSASAVKQKQNKIELQKIIPQVMQAPKVEKMLIPIAPKIDQQQKILQRPQTTNAQKQASNQELLKQQSQPTQKATKNSYMTPNINDRQTQDRQFLDILNRLGQSSINKISALQDLLRCLIDFSPSEILQLYSQQNSLLKEIVQELIQLFIKQEDHSITIAVEVQLDCLEYFLSTLPESLLQEVGPITIVLLSLAQKLKRKEVKVKAEELLQFVSDILTSDLVLPHFIAAIDSTQIALPPDFIILYLNSLVQQTSDLEDDQQFQAVIICMAEQLEVHCRTGSTQPSNIEQNCVKILEKLKKSDQERTVDAIKKLSKTLFVCLKQVINANDKVLSKLLQPVPVEIPKRENVRIVEMQTNFQTISLQQAAPKRLKDAKPQKSDEELVSLCQMLADHTTHVDIKIQIMQKLSNEPHLFKGVIVKDFEELVESLIFHILSSRPHDAELQRLSQKTYALLTSLVCLHQTIPNEGPDIHSLLSQPSVNTPPLSIIEKLVRSILHTYNPDLPAQHQTFANQHAESLLQSIAENFNQDQMSAMITELIREESPPRLQSALRMCEHMIKSQKNVADEELVAVLCQQMNHSDADVRKTVVFCLVEICVRGKLDVNSLGQEFMLNPSQVKLVQIYIQRRLQRMM